MGLLAASCLASALWPLMRELPGPRGLKGVRVGIPIDLALWTFAEHLLAERWK